MAALHASHLVLVEFALNDVGLGAAALPSIETLAVLLLSLPRRPAVLLLGTSSFDLWAERAEPWLTFNGCLLPGDVDPCGFRSLMHEHAEVAHHYGLPAVSAVDALGGGPFDSAALRDFWLTAWKVDPLHISHTAHQLVAALVAGHLWQAASLWDRPPFGVAPSLAWGPLPPPKFADAAALALQLGPPPRVLDPAADAQPGCSVGFSFFEDRPGRPPGWIATAVGSRAVYLLAPADLEGRARVLHASLLHSYEHGGVARLRAYAAAAAPAAADGGTAGAAPSCGEAGAELGGPTTVDTLWALRGSEPEVTVLMIAQPQPGAAGVCVELAVVPADPPRAENKVKLMALELY